MNNISDQISVSVATAFLPEHSSEKEHQFVFTYTITITNNSDTTVKLLSRYWLITDANGDTSTVVGEGVVGEQPIIEPNNSYTYSSGSVFKTPVGTMQGHYQMLDNNNTPIKVDIPVFRLSTPNILN
ncbi:Co2+/Mg2+ efflux protein ApaG [Thalassotalea marina]|uniref:Protein ApaG n=1 Tax=Thalassotalea marina TaxID=1673741 RepID=A0A919BBK8_9GAMM|nr:Co2+/Mg2+ efflux protein ApaG [Thalassotalea marina]GHF78388.1 protein ApaG [Thalassotalea marina]